MTIWKAAAIEPAGDWYQTTGQGMGETLTIADQKGGYTLTDRATYLSKKDSLKLEILVEGDKALFNQYHVITCTKATNMQGANDFMNWIISPEYRRTSSRTYRRREVRPAAVRTERGPGRVGQGRPVRRGRLAAGEAPLSSVG